VAATVISTAHATADAAFGSHDPVPVMLSIPAASIVPVKLNVRSVELVEESNRCRMRPVSVPSGRNVVASIIAVCVRLNSVRPPAYVQLSVPRTGEPASVWKSMSIDDVPTHSIMLMIELPSRSSV